VHASSGNQHSSVQGTQPPRSHSHSFAGQGSGIGFGARERALGIQKDPGPVLFKTAPTPRLAAATLGGRCCRQAFCSVCFAPSDGSPNGSDEGRREWGIRGGEQSTGCRFVRPRSTTTAVREHDVSYMWKKHAARSFIQMSRMQAFLPRALHGHTRCNLNHQTARIFSHLLLVPNGRGDGKGGKEGTKAGGGKGPRQQHLFPIQVQRDRWGYFIKQGVQHQ
jgi:hypothetical protein